MNTMKQRAGSRGREAGRTGRARRALIAAAFAAIAVGAFWAEEAGASSYLVEECTTSRPAAPDFRLIDPNGEYERLDFCSSLGRQQIRATNRTPGGRYAELRLASPQGIRIKDAQADVYLYEQEGIRPIVFRKASGGAQTTLWSGSRGNTRQDFGSDAKDYLGIGMFCSKPAGQYCGAISGGPYGSATIGNARVTVDDVVAPTSSVNGSLFDGKWYGGGVHYIVAGGNDVGAGVAEQEIYVNGRQIAQTDHCPTARGADGIVSRMGPCNPGTYQSITKGGLSVAGWPFEQGENPVEGCTREFGGGAAVKCDQKIAKIDTVAPTKPLGLTAEGGSGWRQVNDFDLQWQAPPQVHAPLKGSFVRVTKTGSDSGWIYYSGSVDKLNDLQVPSPGQYTVSVVLTDEAGNADFSRAATTTIRFDNVPPKESQPEKANGWIGTKELETGYVQEWQQPRTPHPQSGIDGYAAAIDQAPSTDPCDTAGSGGPSSSCSGSEISFRGIDNRSTTLGADRLVEGNNWFHVVPVSGSGVKADGLEHTKLQVDTHPPAVTLEGAGEGWSRSDVAITAVATDDRSGMVDTDDYPDDPPPLTSLEVDGKLAGEPDADVSGTVAGDGVHTVRYWARDLAGNTESPTTTEVKIDGSDPIAVMEKSDRNDPELIAARTSDEVSGVASAVLQYREDVGEWITLASQPNGGQISARINSDEMKQGATYTFQVVATDEAGNTVRTSKTEGGGERTHTGPLRDDSQVSELQINGKRKTASVKYGSAAQLSGVLLDEQGNGVPRAEVTVVESYDAGSKRDQNSIPATTNASGAFSATLPRGPSRTVQARFAGSRTLLAARSAAAPRLEVGGKVRLKVTHKRVRPGKTTRFKGRVAKAGAKVPAGGKLVEVQVKVRNKWRTVDKAQRTNGKGKFNLRYRFGRFYYQPVSFKFRAVVLSEEVWPYKAPVKSKRTQVTVVPKR